MDGPGDSRDWYGLSRRDVLRATGIGVLGWSVLSGATAPISGQTAAEEWSQFRYDNANTGHAPENTGPVTNIERELLFETDGNSEEGGAEWSSPAVVDGTVYTGSWDNNLYTLDADDGTEQWSYDTGFHLSSSPVVVNNTVYVGDYGGVVAVSANDGTERWKIGTGETVSSSPAVVNGTVYFGAQDSNVYTVTGDTSTPEATPTSEATPTPEDEEDVGVIPLMVSGLHFFVGFAHFRQVGIIPLIVLGLLGLGGGGAWWLTRGGGTSDSEGPTDTGSTGTTAESPSTLTTTSGLTGGTASNSDNSAPSQESATEESGPNSPFESLTDPSADTGLLAAIDKSLKKGEDLRDTASDHREAGEYNLALETYDKVREAYEEALDTANESNLINTDKIEQKLTTILSFAR